MRYVRTKVRGRRFLLVGAVVALVVLGGSALAYAAGGTTRHSATGAHTGTASLVAASPLRLHVVGKVNLAHPQKGSALSFHGAAGAQSATAKLRRFRVAPLKLHHGSAGTAAARAAKKAASVAALPSNHSLATIGGNTTTHDFDGLNALTNDSSNSIYLGGFGPVSPPDQGLAVGPGPSGTAVVEMVNDVLDVYSPDGKALMGPVSAFQVFDQPPSTSLSDPRVYWDPSSGHWFITMFAYAVPGGTVNQYGCTNGGAVENDCLSAQFVAVSSTTNPLGSYTVFWFDTSDGTDTSGPGGHVGDDCPCFGDFDQVGSDSNGLYITTNEFCFNTSTACGQSQTGTFNGTVIYAFSKSALISAAEQGGSPSPVQLPPVARYGVNTLDDPFAAYHLSPSTMTQGSSAANTEYFVESNANLPGDPTIETSGLEVYALLGTSALNHGGQPQLVNTSVDTENYTAVPPQAVQESGPMPWGEKVCLSFQAPCAVLNAPLDTDFNAVQETTYANGLLYTELDTGLGLGMQENAGAAWFVLKPTPSPSSVSATNAGNGYVETSQNILYPAISVNANGQGFMAFSMAGPTMYPSAAYVAFNGTHGPGSVVHVAAGGVDPLDDFSCYAPFTQTSPNSCRAGDYSMAQEFNGTTYMAAEYVPAGQRDTLTNWGTRVYAATDGTK
jgi:hypothetical protein